MVRKALVPDDHGLTRVPAHLRAWRTVDLVLRVGDVHPSPPLPQSGVSLNYLLVGAIDWMVPFGCRYRSPSRGSGHDDPGSKPPGGDRSLDRQCARVTTCMVFEPPGGSRPSRPIVRATPRPATINLRERSGDGYRASEPRTGAAAPRIAGRRGSGRRTPPGSRSTTSCRLPGNPSREGRAPSPSLPA